MCDYSGKLVACMDGELPEREAAEVERHLEICAECRECLAAFQQVSGAFDAYCEATVCAADETRIAETRAKLAVFFTAILTGSHPFFRDPNRVAKEPRAEGAARRGLLSRLKPRPTKRDVSVAIGASGIAAAAEKRREIPRLAQHFWVPSPGNFLCALTGRGSLRADNVKPKEQIPGRGLLRADGEKQKRVRVAIGVSGIAAAAAIAVLLMLPRHRIIVPVPRQIPGQIARQVAGQLPGRAPASVAAGAGTLHAVQRPVESVEPVGIDASRASRMMPPPTVAAKKGHRRVALATEGIRDGVGEARHQAGNQVPSVGPAENAAALAPEPPIEIAIPGDAMFPPGAVPDGISFTAVVTIAADGSAQGMGLRPRLAGFERGGNRP
jgi:hypothetical protein